MKASLVASATASHPWSAGNAIEKLMQNISVLAAGGGGQYTLDCWIDRDTGGGQYTLDCWIDRDTGGGQHTLDCWIDRDILVVGSTL